MAVTAKFYGNAFYNMLNKQIDWLNDDIQVLLCTASYIPDQDNHSTLTNITNEVTGTGYSRKSLTTKTIVYESTSNTLTLDADDVSWTTATFDYQIAVVFDNTSLKLIAYIDFGATQSVIDGTATIMWDATGIGKITVS